MISSSAQMFHRCQRSVTGLQSRRGHCTEQEERLLVNVVSSLAQSLQDLSTNFRHTQSSYLKRKEVLILFKIIYVDPSWMVFLLFCCFYHADGNAPGMKNREERSKHFFDSGPLMEEDEELALYDKVRGFCFRQHSESRTALLQLNDDYVMNSFRTF